MIFTTVTLTEITDELMYQANSKFEELVMSNTIHPWTMPGEWFPVYYTGPNNESICRQTWPDESVAQIWLDFCKTLTPYFISGIIHADKDIVE